MYPRNCINQLIHIAELASICRRRIDCEGSIVSYGIDFKFDAASDILGLADALCDWCESKDECCKVYISRSFSRDDVICGY